MASLDRNELNHTHTTLSQLRLVYIYNYIFCTQSFGRYKLVWYMLYMLFNRKNKQMFLQKNDSTIIHSVTKIRNKYLSKRLCHKALHTAFKGLYVAIVDFKWTTTFSTIKNIPHRRETCTVSINWWPKLGRVARRPLSELLIRYPLIYFKILLLIWRYEICKWVAVSCRDW